MPVWASAQTSSSRSVLSAARLLLLLPGLVYQQGNGVLAGLPQPGCLAATAVSRSHRERLASLIAARRAVASCVGKYLCSFRAWKSVDPGS